MRTLITLMVLAGVCPAQKVSIPELVQMARMRTAGLEQALRDTLGAENIQKGTAAAGEMGDFVFAVASEKGPALQIKRARARSATSGRSNTTRSATPTCIVFSTRFFRSLPRT